MIAAPLTRRKTQLELLAEACGQRRRARVARAERSYEHVLANTRFAALEPQALLLEWPSVAPAPADAEGCLVDVFFEVAEEFLAFRTPTRGRGTRSYPDRGDVAVWELAVPLRIERRQQRVHYRLSLADIGHIPARFTSISNPQRTFTAEVANLSCGGLCGTAPGDAACTAQVDELFWTEFNLPDERGAYEFVVRVVHARHMAARGSVALGCVFCPGEHPLTYRVQLHQIAQFVAHRRHGGPGCIGG